MSESAVLRVAGLPIRLWLAAAAPGLAAGVRALEHAESAYRREAAALAVRLGEELVPRPGLPAEARRTTLSVRRGLHRGRPLPEDQSARLKRIAPELSPCLDRMLALSADVGRREERVRALLAEEHDRLLAAPWHLLHEVPGGRACLPPEVVADIERRLSGGEPWTSKRMRRRSDYLWRMIARGAAKTTPRTWLGHVCLIPVAPTGPGLSVNGQVAVDWTENVQARRHDLARSGKALDPGHLLALTPLHRMEGDRLRIWTTDPASADHRLLTYRMRYAAALGPVVEALRGGTRPVADLEPAAPPGFVGRLVELGVLEVSAPLRQRPGRWTATTPEHGAADTGFVDVYRRAAGAFTADLADLQHAVEQYRRLSLLVDADAGGRASRLRERIGPRPRPVMDVFAEEIAARVEEGELDKRTPPDHGWPVPSRTGSGYARLLGLLAAAPGWDVTEAMLDAAGAPRARLDWPVDCVVRPLPSGGWALDNLAPAAVLDARFVETLRRLHGTVPSAEAYRDFLAELDRITGIPSVELLMPPMVEQAANAVRRPRYTSAWTGDPDPRHYGTAWAEGGARYLPLGELTVHSEDGRAVVCHAGAPVRICTHVTRTPLVPWSVLTAILCADSPQHAANVRRLRRSLTAFPGQAHVPRITVAGSLVVSAAQWRLPSAELAADGDLAGFRTLTRLRDRLGLPRWVFVAGASGYRPLACDLDSVRALRVIEQVLKAGGEELTVTEMLPAADELSVSDHGGGQVAAEVLLRLPHAMPPTELAALAAQVSAGST
ncbi:hypothetical protein [Nonomuraea longicatena]|uniref:Lantibiotic dehydratase N-terminal domain-containing protein n=1 Tax=Nonomuraea longicatena TaxID=83682 RepID=A0ABN1NQM3_9ACTN